MKRDKFDEYLQNSLTMANNLLRILSKRLRIADQQIQLLATPGTSGRVARQILILVEQCRIILSNSGITPSSTEVMLPYPLTKEDLASMVGVTRGPVYDAVREYTKCGYISYNDHWITIHDEAALVELCT